MRANKYLSQCRPGRAGYSLLEVVLASSICLTALVPALALLRDSMSNASKIDTRQLMLLCGVSKMEEQLAVVAAGWTTGSLNGNFASDGFPGIRYSVIRSDSPANGGLTNRLMNIAVTVYSDDNNNLALDANEMQTSLATKISKLVTYQSLVGN